MSLKYLNINEVNALTEPRIQNVVLTHLLTGQDLVLLDVQESIEVTSRTTQHYTLKGGGVHRSAW